MIAVIDYGVGNLNSITNMIRAVGGECEIVSNHRELKNKKKIILPGVGAFDHGMACLEKGDWIGPLSEILGRLRGPNLEALCGSG